MATQTLATQVDSLEQRVSRLEELQARVVALTLQVSQLRDEMRVEFSAVRDEIRTGDEETRRVLRDEIRTGLDGVRTGLDEVMAQARLLHEDRKATLKCGRDPSTANWRCSRSNVTASGMPDGRSGSLMPAGAHF